MRIVKIYLGGGITGLSFADVTKWRNDLKNTLCQRPLYFPVISEEVEFQLIMNSDIEIHCLNPLRGKDYLSQEIVLGKSYEDTVLSQSKSIVLRDGWDVDNSDICVFNFLGAKTISIGSVWEIGRAHARGKLVLLLMEKNNIHNHPMITQMSLPFVETIEALIDLIRRVV